MAGTRIGVVGAGIIGLAVARRLAELAPDATVTVLEKEQEIAMHQTGRNSGVVHAGIYYPPGSLKARLCRRGVELLRAYCDERGIPLVECGKLVVALDESELERLRELERRAAANGVPGMRWLDGDALREIEPHAAGIAGLHSPTTGITDYRGVAQAFADDVRGGRRHPSCLGRRGALDRDEAGKARVATAEDEFEFDLLVICAGLQSDRLARLAGDEHEPTIVPFRGEYFRLTAEREQLVRGLLYPVPDPAYPFLGVHFTRRVNGGVDVGPERRSRLRTRGLPPPGRPPRRPRRDAPLAAASGRSRASTGAWEHTSCAGSLSKRAFAAEARRYVPERDRRRPRARTGRRARAGARPRRLPRRRLPHQPARPDHRRPQRSLTGSDIEHGDRRAHRSVGPGVLTPPASRESRVVTRGA